MLKHGWLQAGYCKAENTGRVRSKTIPDPASRRVVRIGSRAGSIPWRIELSAKLPEERIDIDHASIKSC
jgi:hypothetical protein